MMSRMQITLDQKLRNRVQKRAERLGVPIAEYVRQAIEKDLGEQPTRASVSELFDLGRSKEPTDISKDKHKMIADALAAAKLGE
jgi:Ribbon-helix-helix domain